MTTATATRPSVAVTFPDGCVLTYSHPDGDEFPRADLVMGPDANHPGHDDNRIGEAVGRAFLDALRQALPYDPDPTNGSDTHTEGDRTMPEGVDPNALSLALILTAAGVAPAAALVTGLVSLLGNLGSLVDGRERLLAFLLSAVLVVFAYVATSVTFTAVTGFGAFLAFYAIARLSLATYDDFKAKPNSLRGPSA